MGLQFTNALKAISYVQNVMIVLESVLFAGNLMKGLPLETDLLKILPSTISAKLIKIMKKIAFQVFIIPIPNPKHERLSWSNFCMDISS